MTMRLVLFLVAFLAGFALAQSAPNGMPSQCQTKCNLQGSECMKGCVGDPKDAAKPDKSQHMVRCMKNCDDALRQCKSGCGDKP
jgi:hypothetical protein